MPGAQPVSLLGQFQIVVNGLKFSAERLGGEMKLYSPNGRRSAPQCDCLKWKFKIGQIASISVAQSIQRRIDDRPADILPGLNPSTALAAYAIDRLAGEDRSYFVSKPFEGLRFASQNCPVKIPVRHLAEERCRCARARAGQYFRRTVEPADT
ncbi:MAG: hypothetical protein EOR74_02155 [Mesorhizobium sp.]|nr:MAG: hypothetical protein EOR74_02155 [Mesorhizobium sp.]